MNLRFSFEVGEMVRIKSGPFQAFTGRVEEVDRNSGKLKVGVDIWGKPRNDASLMRRLKTAFDPGNVFAPGRFVAGI